MGGGTEGVSNALVSYKNEPRTKVIVAIPLAFAYFSAPD